MKTISTFVIGLLLFSFLFLALPEKGNAGVTMLTTCCQGFDMPSCEDDGPCCENLDVLSPQACLAAGGELETGDCQMSGFCSGFIPPVESRNVPTLTEWGLIATASILGFIGFMVIRRRKATA